MNKKVKEIEVITKTGNPKYVRITAVVSTAYLKQMKNETRGWLMRKVAGLVNQR